MMPDDSAFQRDQGLDMAVDGSTEDSGPASGGRSLATSLPRFAVVAADKQIGRISDALTGAADTIDGLVSDEATQLPEAVRDLIRSASGKLRGVADSASEQDAAGLLNGLQQLAAKNPAVTAGIGAAIGAALGLALARIGIGGGAAPEASATGTQAGASG
jgi:ElaB/YqjD/DUF883 family membrane-anchored ribosome-binding protein